MKILFKYPTRNRPDRFFEGLDSILNNLLDKRNFEIQITADVDDPHMTDRSVFDRISQYPNTHIIYGFSNSKIDAVNRDMKLFKDWDIVVVMSDDMRFTFHGFDEVIRQQFQDGNFDKYIHLPDQDAKHHLATMYIAGRDFYERFGYIYNPEFKSLWCDNLVQDIAKALGTYHFVNMSGLFVHLNPAYGHLPKDEMFLRQQADWGYDEAKYNEIKARGYDLHLFKK